MTDESTIPKPAGPYAGLEPGADKRGHNPRSLANLRPSKKGEPSRNPEGHNGRRRSEIVAAFLEAPEDTELGKKLIAKLGLPPETPRIIAVLQREVLAALGKSDLARKGLREQYGGKPRISADLTNSDGSLSPNRKPTTAETRQELDRVLAALQGRASAPPAESTESSEDPESPGNEGTGEPESGGPKAEP